MNLPEFKIQLPDWVESFLAETGCFYSQIEERMGFVIELSRRNIEQKTGGPFAAAVFDHQGNLIAPGVNMVVSTNCSILHAELVAIALAQKILGRYDIGDGGKHHYDLVTSAEPCAMCLGGIHWSGISRIICGARGEDTQKIGFDEGAKPVNWISQLESRGITVISDILRQKAIEILDEYKAAGGLIYKAGRQEYSPKP
ncbi:MAG: tRNA-specific adenosine deaminase [Planctomycetes bacterium RBG_13_44_8b]|nr:MAG: tRNA-specific adenosine deaminase [Planctomycetes bacterium RBG_13_44_8b]